VPTTKSNGIDLNYETFGDPGDPTILLVMGLGAQMVAWDEAFCTQFVDRGFQVVRFDNRDIGCSTWIDTPDLDVGAALMSAIGGDTSVAPYLLKDMAADAIGLLDQLGIDQAHVVGASMGGMIAQQMAIDHPERLRSLTSIMSTTGEPEVGQAAPELLAAMLTPRPTEREAVIDLAVEMARSISYPDYFDPKVAQERVAREYDRGFNPTGVTRQLLAILCSGSRAEGLKSLDLPTLVIHGKADPLVNVSGGERTAELVSGSELLVIDDMAHDLPFAHWPRIAEAIVAVAARAN